jgi:hypothetical protein
MFAKDFGGLFLLNKTTNVKSTSFHNVLTKTWRGLIAAYLCFGLVQIIRQNGSNREKLLRNLRRKN